MAEIGACEGCGLRQMLRMGCCTQDVGLGTKRVRIKGRVVEVCSELEPDGLCRIYYSSRRPEACAGWSCEAALLRQAGEDGNDEMITTIWNL